MAASIALCICRRSLERGRGALTLSLTHGLKVQGLACGCHKYTLALSPPDGLHIVCMGTCMCVYMCVYKRVYVRIWVRMCACACVQVCLCAYMCV